MRTATSTAAIAARRGGSPRLVLDSWLGGDWLARLPISRESWDLSDSLDQVVPGELHFEVPRLPKWVPTHPAHPLAKNGQQVSARIGWQHPGQAAPDIMPAGWYRITDVELTKANIRVTAQGRLWMVEQARFLTPWSTAGLTRGQAVAKLLAGIIPYRITGLVDEPCPAAVYETDRIAALREIVDGWPARIRMDSDGVAVITAPLDDDDPGAPVATLARGLNLTEEVVPDSSRPPAYNAVVVSSTGDGLAPVVSETVVQVDGPLRWGGPYGYRPTFYTSPMLAGVSRSRMREVGAQQLTRALTRSQSYQVTALPDYRIEAGDVVAVVDPSSGIDMIGRVMTVTHRTTATVLVVAYLDGERGAL